MKSWSLRLTILVSLASLAVCGPFREKRGTFYVNNPNYATCVGDDGRMGYCLFQGCFVNDLTYKGRCGFGLGSCCLAEQSCLRSTNVNNTYFVNPGFPQSTTSMGSCELVVKRRTKDICQIRLDFIDFDLEQPDKDGHCYNDVLTIIGSQNKIHQMCGSSPGQHMYIAMDPYKNDEHLIILIRIKELTLMPRRWNIKVTQIECSSQTKAPAGCLQYYTGVEDVVNSFNFVNNLEGFKGTRQLADSSYSACVRQESGYCEIMWTSNEEAGPLSFALTGDVNAVAKEELGTPFQSSKKCSENNDFVLISNGRDEHGNRADRLCGLGFASRVTSNVTPFMMHVKTGRNEDGDNMNTGFSLRFKQKKCKHFISDDSSVES